ncbi:TPA: di-trans,poly-cis-decaprenylcistransferase [Candidatus Woesearchaeota archaeon]|nr:di-trans,poly-cis-decaprenylcistransferase [Candidatus Woesearchaeota archaeon]HIH54435.1 di-trans,poly-cis-decaprenylcistransferase [Candidatus Woesearchaeota archaeon]HIJ02281.1 di-trans,poly-cis-decaprenylcistransferase [Candidatus Woesearchaeota archaeon]HIJ14225.1 di-trans,poly-cis-decaprenylcistransferase [Candidatus Woesearchaeota archaeon]
MSLHLAIILDGNRRFAKRLMLEPWKGHEYGAKRVELLLEWCKEFKINELTLYSFSIQNFNRPKEEFNYLMKLFSEMFTKFADDPRIKKNEIKIRFLGRYELFPKELASLFKEIAEKTKNNSKFILNFAMAYGGREEIVDAIKKIVSEHPEPEKITEDYVEKHLYIDSAPDIIIRTGGEKRTSNFLPWQSVYSELFFIDKTWPEFEKEDLVNILNEYNQRERRFGK